MARRIKITLEEQNQKVTYEFDICGTGHCRNQEFPKDIRTILQFAMYGIIGAISEDINYESPYKIQIVDCKESRGV